VVSKTVRIETYSLKFWREKNFYRTDRDLSIVRQRQRYKPSWRSNLSKNG
jgi:hypothetical protein